MGSGRDRTWKEAHPSVVGGGRLTALHAAALSGSHAIVLLPVDRGVDVSVRDTAGDTPLHHVAGAGRLRVVGLLLEPGAAMHVTDSDGATPAHLALPNGHAKVAAFLMARSKAVSATQKEEGAPESTPSGGVPSTPETSCVPRAET